MKIDEVAPGAIPAPNISQNGQMTQPMPGQGGAQTQDPAKAEQERRKSMQVQRKQIQDQIKSLDDQKKALQTQLQTLK